MVETYKGIDRLTFKYDYMGRRVEKCVYSSNILTSKTLFVYDGFKCVEEMDALNGNAVLKRHAWQPSDVWLDVILATAEGDGTSYFLHDASKNVMQKKDDIGLPLNTNQYSPFGDCSLSNVTLYSFSSEKADVILNLTYYNYRYYYPEIGRWLNYDPLETHSPDNLFLFSKNSPNNFYDELGLVAIIVIPFNNETNLGYYDGNKHRYVPDHEVRKGKTGENDINGFGGYYVYPNPSICCCKNSQIGRVKLVQLINKDNKGFHVDIGNNDLHDKRREGYRDNGRVVGYIDDGGRPYPRYIGGYIDAPGLSKVNNKLARSLLSYSAYILIEAYCMCNNEDEYLGQSVLLYVHRKAFHKNIDIISIRNGHSSSLYPRYDIPSEKGFSFDWW